RRLSCSSLSHREAEVDSGEHNHHRAMNVKVGTHAELSKGMWRRGGDLNPRWSYPHSGFRDRCTKPLCDLSAYEDKSETGFPLHFCLLSFYFCLISLRRA